MSTMMVMLLVSSVTSRAVEQPAPLKLVLDTSVFTNPATAAQFGNTTAAAFSTFIQLAERAEGRVEVYMPPSIYEELQTFLGDASPPPRFEVVVRLKAPNRYAVQVPGHLLYELIEDIRARIDRGLRLAEKAVRETIQENVERTIGKFRDRYRDALRLGLLDSREDVDLILLAVELGAALVSSDTGVVRWAERLGVRIVHPENLRGALEQLAQ